MSKGSFVVVDRAGCASVFSMDEFEVAVYINESKQLRSVEVSKYVKGQGTVITNMFHCPQSLSSHYGDEV